MSAPAFAIGVPASSDELDVAGTLASLHASAERVARPYEIVVAVNGPGDAPPAMRGVRDFAARTGLPLHEAEVAEDDATAPPAVDSVAAARGGDVQAADPDADKTGADRSRLVLLRLRPRSKVAAWNAIRRATAAPIVVFADADVRVAPDAVPLLVGRLSAEPALAAVAGREQATVTPADGLVARVAALPYRFDFGNVPGRLYALRTSALSEPMPARVLAEDAYLTVRLGRARFVKEPRAVVYLRPPTTWADYVRQRVRHELGKLQLTREFGDLHRAHGFGRYPWGAFVRTIAPGEYPLVALALAARVYARVQARRATRTGFPTGWTMLASTKQWATVGGGPPSVASGPVADLPQRGPLQERDARSR